MWRPETRAQAIQAWSKRKANPPNGPYVTVNATSCTRLPSSGQKQDYNSLAVTSGLPPQTPVTLHVNLRFYGKHKQKRSDLATEALAHAVTELSDPQKNMRLAIREIIWMALTNNKGWAWNKDISVKIVGIEPDAAYI
jgi:hypothetical protein